MSTPTIPMPRLRIVRNETPFEHWECQKMAVGRRFFDTVVLKGTFVLASGRIGLSDQQAPIELADAPWDTENAERSSLKQAGDVLLVKPSTDVIVTGTARAPGGKARSSWDAAVEVRLGSESVLHCRAQVLGPRRWRHTAAKGWSLTEPEPTAEVPIRYELAYGGAYATTKDGAPAKKGGDDAEILWVAHRPNPSGTGFFDERVMDSALEYPAPQWQAPAQPVTLPNHEVALAGFGPIARPWSSRLNLAGTYDGAWLARTRAEVAQGLPSDYAADFDPRFFQCAHPELIAPRYLQGNEEIVLTGLMPDAEPFRFLLPGVQVEAGMLDRAENPARGPIPLDTVHIDLDAATVSLCWRLTLDHAQDIEVALFNVKEIA